MPTYFVNPFTRKLDGVDSAGIGNPLDGATAGSLLFVDSSGNLGQDNSNFFWDETNKRLGVGTATPNTPFEVYGSGPQLRISDSDSAGYAEIDVIQSGAFNISVNGSKSVQFRAGIIKVTGWRVQNSNDDLSIVGAQRVGQIPAALRIGNEYDLTSEAQSVLTVYGDNLSTEIFRIQGNGTIGIGETAPDAMLEIVANATTEECLHLKAAPSQSADIFRVTDSSDTDLITIDSSGDIDMLSSNAKITVGDGAGYPSITFDAVGSSTSDPIIRTADDTIGAVIVAGTSWNRGAFLWLEPGGSGNEGMLQFNYGAYDYTSPTGKFTLYHRGDSASVKVMEADTNNNVYFPNGDVGVGTESPATEFHVNGEATIGEVGGNEGVLKVQGSGHTNFWLSVEKNRITFNYASGNYVEFPAGRQLIFQDSDSLEFLRLSDNLGQVIVNEGSSSDVDFRVEGDTDVNLLFTDASEDSVGIGTGTPDAMLEIETNETTKEVLHLKAAPSQTADIMQWTDSSDNVLGAIDSSGKVGIGTESPSVALHVISDIRSQHVSSTSDFVQFEHDGTRGSFLSNRGDLEVKAYTNLVFISGDSGTDMTIVGTTGNVGIGVTDPDAKLEIVSDSATEEVLHLKAAASQTADILRVTDSSDNDLLTIRDNGTIQPASLADASADNDSIYYSTDASKLVYKDSGGTVNNLY